jgi:hypothetical protein
MTKLPDLTILATPGGGGEQVSNVLTKYRIQNTECRIQNAEKITNVLNFYISLGKKDFDAGKSMHYSGQ